MADPRLSGEQIPQVQLRPDLRAEPFYTNSACGDVLSIGSSLPMPATSILGHLQDSTVVEAFEDASCGALGVLARNEAITWARKVEVEE